MTDKSFEIPLELKQLLSPNQAFRYRVIPFSRNGELVSFKTDSRNLKKLTNELEVLLNFNVVLLEDTEQNIESYLSYNYRKRISKSSGLSQERFLEQLLQTAQEFNSSDIHIEPYEKLCRVRFRLDGKLKEQYSIPPSKYLILVNQIKIKADLDISQSRVPQDGRITEKSGRQEFDIRVSTMPTIHGEKVVLRILKQNTEASELSQLGFSPSELELYLEEIRKPNGIVLISGPTGSGKTTTLYSTLKILNKEETNIVTIEDPIEYTLEGINQVQLKEDIGLNFPKALRTFLRQDPDIIMVGEIRDEKTANMAIRAALTGHLVLSTIHTNSAWATISRLIDMGVPPFLLASTLNISVAQRLVRKLCKSCKKETPIKEALLPKNFDSKTQIKKHYTPNGCEECFYTGYQGRVAVYEIIPITRELENKIKLNEFQIDNYIAENNISLLKTNAITLINSGETSIDEVYSLLTN